MAVVVVVMVVVVAGGGGGRGGGGGGGGGARRRWGGVGGSWVVGVVSGQHITISTTLLTNFDVCQKIFIRGTNLDDPHTGDVILRFRLETWFRMDW